MNEIKAPRGGSNYQWVGKNTPRPDGVDKVTGRARYGDDMIVPGMLHGKILRSPHAHAKIQSIDTSKAEMLDGVKAVVTSADIPDHPMAQPPYPPIVNDFHDISRNVMAREKVQLSLGKIANRASRNLQKTLGKGAPNGPNRHIP